LKHADHPPDALQRDSKRRQCSGAARGPFRDDAEQEVFGPHLRMTHEGRLLEGQLDDATYAGGGRSPRTLGSGPRRGAEGAVELLEADAQAAQRSGAKPLLLVGDAEQQVFRLDVGAGVLRRLLGIRQSLLRTTGEPVEWDHLISMVTLSECSKRPLKMEGRPGSASWRRRSRRCAPTAWQAPAPAASPVPDDSTRR